MAPITQHRAGGASPSLQQQQQHPQTGNGGLVLKGPDVGRAALIDALVRSALRGVPGDDLQRAALHNKLNGWALRVLGSHLSSGAPALGDAGSVVQAMKQLLRQQQRDAEAGGLDDRYARLAASRAMSGRAQQAALALLLQLARGGGGGGGGGELALNPIATYQPPRLIKPAPLLAAARDAPSGGTPDQNRPQRGAGQLQQAAAARAAGQAPGCTVPEKELVRDALRVAQGCAGTYCSFPRAPLAAAGAGAGAGAALDGGAGLHVAAYAEAGVPWPQRIVMHVLGELGVMFRAVQAHIEEGSDPARPRGAVRQALCAALQRELTEFYGFLAGLEQQLQHPLPAPGCADEEVLSAPFLTLRRLLLWVGEPMRRMRLLAAIADGTASADGGALAGMVWGHTKRGDPLARAYASRLLQQVCVPLFDQIRRWVFEGRLVDPHLEFFIVQTGALAAGGGGGGAGGGGWRDPWREVYRIETAKLPPFINRTLAESILRAGKGINFLRDSCGDAAWVQSRAAAGPAAAAAAGAGAGAAAGQAEALERVVAAATREVDARLMDVLRERQGLARHCDALRRYVLLGQGDFAVALLDAMSTELSKPAHEVSEVTLNHLLRQAVLSSAARADDEDTLERLRAKKDPGAGARELGWDVLSLQYEVGAPLSSLFTPAAMASYRRVAKLQWRLARAERSLGLAWRTLKVEVERELPKFRAPARAALERLLRSCLRLRADMAHFATNMRTYVTYEVLEGAWREFQSAAASCQDLDALIARHEAFLSALLGRALLDDSSAQVRSTLNGVLANMLGLAPMVGRLNDEVKRSLLWMEDRARSAAANTAAGRWGVVDSDLGERPDEEVDGQLVEELEGVAAQLEAAHLAGVRRLTEQLLDERQGGVAHAFNEVHYLLCRLDRAFYERQASAREGGGGGAAAGAAAGGGGVLGF